MVFDKEANVFIFEKILLPTTDHERFKLNLVSCMRIGEEVTKAVFGSLEALNESFETNISPIDSITK